MRTELVQSVVRSAVQLAWGAVVAWLTVRHLPVPDAVSSAVTQGAVAVVTLAVVAALRWLETRTANSWFGPLASKAATVLMLGTGKLKPVYNTGA